MEGGQKQKIDLESGLDVKSSDQLVPVTRPLFQHNRQRFQGSMLPTSLRFEHNGFGAGWDVYEFETNYFTVDTDPARFTVMRQQINANPTYVFRLRIGTTTYAMVYWNGEDVVKTGELEISRDEDNMALVTLKGDNDGHGLELTINMITGEIGYDDSEWFLVESDYSSATSSAGQTDLSLLDLTSWIEFNAAVVLPEDVTYEGNPVASYYSCVEQDDGSHVHTWSDVLSANSWTVTYNDETGEAMVNGEAAVASLDKDTGQLSITYDTSYEGTISVGVEGQVFYFQIYGIGPNIVQSMVSSSATKSLNFELWDCQVSGATYLYPTNLSRKAYVTGYVPYWCGMQMYNVTSSVDASILSFFQQAVLDSTPVSSYLGIYSGYAYLVSDTRYLSFYNNDFRGVNASYFEGGKDVTSEYASIASDLGLYADIEGSLTYCVCLFNRKRVSEDWEDEYSYYPYPFTVGTNYNSNAIEYTDDQVPWFDGGTYMSKDMATETFLPGYYVPMEEVSVEVVSRAGGGFMLVSGWPVETSLEGQYVYLDDYNALLKLTAETLRDNAEGLVLFVEGAGDYVRRDRDALVEPFLEEADVPSGYIFVTVDEWNVAAGLYNSSLAKEDSVEEETEEEDASVELLSVGDYSIVQIGLEDTKYARESLWAIARQPEGYRQDTYSGSLVIGDDASEYAGCMRLEWPYAFYDIPVSLEAFDGTRYDTAVNTAAAAGAGSIEILLQPANKEYTDAGTGLTYWLGDGFTNEDGTEDLGYLVVDYRTTGSSSDTRTMSGLYTESSSESGSYEYSSTLHIGYGGILSALVLGTTVSLANETTLSYTAQRSDVISWFQFNSAAATLKEQATAGVLAKFKALGEGWVMRSSVSVSDTGWEEKYMEWFVWRYRKLSRTAYVTVAQQVNSLSLSAALSESGGDDSSGETVTNRSVISITESGDHDITEALRDILAIPPIAAYIHCSGIGGTDSARTVNPRIWLSVCFEGRYQYELSLNSPSSGPAVITQDNFSELVSFSKSGDNDLLTRQGVYIDRELAGNGGLYGFTSFVGRSCVDLVLNAVSIGQSGAQLDMFFRPVLKDSGEEYDTFYVHYAKSSFSGDAYIPGETYNNDVNFPSTGYGLVGESLGYTYSTSSIAFSIKADTVEFFKADSISVSWPSASGTHRFFSETLPLAISGLEVEGQVFQSPANTRDGVASSRQSLNFLFGDEAIQLMVDWSMEDGEGSTSLSLTEGEGPIWFGGYPFSFSLKKSGWGDGEVDVALAVSVPLTYDFSAVPPYQYNYGYSFSYDSASGKYLIDGKELDAVPVGTLAAGFSPTEMTYTFLSDEGYKYQYNSNSDTFTYGITSYTGTDVGKAKSVLIEGYEYLEYSFILEGAYKTYKCTIVSFDGTNITVEYDGTQYTFPYSELMTDEEPDEMNFMYTDTRDEKAIPDTVTFARQNFEKEYQFLRQTWETTNAVENYWWIDSETILELNKTSLTVKKKLIFEDYAEEATVDDWGGDFWEDAASFPRYEYLDNTVARYGVTCAYGDSVPRFWTIREVSDTKFKLTFYKLNEVDYGTSKSYSLDDVSTTVSLNVVKIGETLNNPNYDRLNTYSQLNMESLLYDSKFSATVVGEHILFGIHNDNNFNQWALDIYTTGELAEVVQGYGFVGVDGRLTGGEIPSAWFDPSLGFTGAVMPIETIEQDEDLDVSTPAEFIALDCGDIVVGDESQQWYISKKISAIVSHLVWDEEAEMWGTKVLYLNNNVDQTYGSASFGANVVSEKGIAYYNFLTEFTDSFESASLNAVINVLGMVAAFYMIYLSPRLTTMLYLQQTMGQYAYVHYNSDTPGKQVDQGRVNTAKDASKKWYGEEGVRGRGYSAGGTATEEVDPNMLDPVTPDNQDDFSFNLHTIRQQAYIDRGWAGLGFAAVMVLMQGMLSLVDTVSGEIKVNARSGDTDGSSLGKQFSQVFLRNMDKLASIDTNIIGTMPVQNSALTGVLTLDMFYSTSEGQHVNAGPGWVQHNFAAQCVAQSVTSNQMELNQVGIFIPMSEFGTLVYKIATTTLRYVADAIIDSVAIWASGGDQYGIIGAAAFVTATVACATKYALQICLDITDTIDQFLRSFTGSRPLAQTLNTASKHFYDMEGKHKYGQKSEVFMWPCWGITSPLEYENESVEALCENVPWSLAVPTGHDGEMGGGNPQASGTIEKLDVGTVTYNVGSDITLRFNGDVPYMVANCRGKTETTQCPEDMAAVIGCESFLPQVPFRNENIGVSPPNFITSNIQDYIIDKDWELSMTCGMGGLTTWVSCKDTKLIDGAPSNIVISDEFCGVACPYTAIEVQRGYEQKYMRAWAVTPMAIGLNQSGLNAAYEEKAYHAFDGYGGRVVKWCGAPGMNKEGIAKQYAFIVNDRFKRSNNVGPNTWSGNFKGEPILALTTLGEDEVYNEVAMDGRKPMLSAGAIGEDRDVARYATPVFAEPVSTLPAVLKTISSYNLAVIDGITSFTSQNTDKQSAYKAPTSIDFAIGHNKYRFTDEYICELKLESGVTTVSEVVPTLGLTYLGSTPYEAYLYSAATRQYYTFSGGSSLDAVDTLERFRNIVHGRYDFVNQEVVMPCVATFVRLDKHVFDDEDERDNTIVPRLKDGKFVGEVWPPIETIWNMRSGFKTISLPSGICFQGPNRCIINRFVYSDYMKNQIIENAGQWKRVPRETYHPFREYEDEYVKVDENVLLQIVGWTHNPFLLVTSPLGVSSEVDCVFEWEITFAWPVEMDDLYTDKQYACVNVMAETFTPGGKVIPERPTHVFLYRDLFTRTGNYGYYSFRYQSRCGAGNRERLHIWSDQYIAVSGLQVEYKQITEKRTEVLTQQVDVQDMEEV